MAITDGMINELKHEAEGTRRTLERVPEGKNDWQPHPKSMKLGALAGHLAESIGWTKPTLESDVFEIPGDYKPFIANSTAELLAKFDEGLADSLAIMNGYPDEKMFAKWSMKMGGKVVLEMPRVAVVRSMILNHLVHHRAQLGVYLRLLDIPVPALYGPSADEQPAPK